MEKVSHMDVKFMWGNSNYDYVFSEAAGNSGGILCIWEESFFKKDYVTISDSFVAIYGTWIPSKTKLLVVSIYAPQQPSLRRVLWEYLLILLGRWNGEAILMGDYNEVRTNVERRDISDPVPKDGFNEADVVSLTHQPIDIRGVPSGLLFCAGLAVTWEFPKFYPLFKDPEGNDPKIVATRVRKAQAAAKRKAGKHKGSEGTSGPEKGSKRRKEQATDHIPCPTPLQTIEGVASDASRGENVVAPTQAQGDNLLEIPAHDSANTTTHPCEEHHDENSGVLGTGDDDFDDGVDEEIDLEGPERHVNDTTERVVLDTESIPPVATRPDTGKSIAQEETPMPDPLLRVLGPDEAGSSLPPPLFVPTWGIHQRSRVTTPEECRDLMANLTPPGVQERSSFESLYDSHHALKEDLETTRSHLVRSREDFTIVQNFYNTLSERNRKLREEHDQCSERLAVVQTEKDGLMATNAEQALRIKELEQQLKSADEVHSSTVKTLESQLAQKDSALVYAERISSDRLSENEELRTQLAFAKREKIDAVRTPSTVVGRLPTKSRIKASLIFFCRLSVLSNYAFRLGGDEKQGLAEARSEEELRELMMRMNGFDAYSDKKMNAEYERLFSKTYSYVDRISQHVRKSCKPSQDLILPPPPKDAPRRLGRCCICPQTC
ncbi:RNA-directed DNA polymerase, eukaryota [Tanacetum coccineum]